MVAPRKGADLLLRATPGDRRYAASTRRYKARLRGDKSKLYQRQSALEGRIVL